ncbi:(2Fe-2S)-binding protein [Phytoactinopolyspora limicola]|uniref:(2Fe-2S)-binding protein n=1 Tax=Phytoactinopolyspora limicola TaxID=2715536 RepID=UPI0014091A2E|nr:(2Fe-2S)-binding protein [Phytoactinopolyspora limicola]
MSYSFTLNGQTVEATTPGLTPLLTVLRDQHGLQGAKLGCGEGRCGSCTVLVDDQPVAACLFPVANVAGRAVRTVEGLAAPGAPLTPVQDALLDHGGVQCGACIPGVVMTLTALLESEPAVDAATAKEALTGNICRCTGYVKIVEAAVAASGRGDQA